MITCDTINNRPENCGNCEFFSPHRQVPETGRCQRYPPQTSFATSENYGTVGSTKYCEQPRTCIELWCGEWRERKNITENGGEV